ncbi:MAG: penicillin-binding transpeptidase domain-containing protein [bacterium]
MYKYRLRVILIVIFGGFLMVSTRLFYLQVVQGEEYRHYAENVRVRREATEACRGRVLAAGGELLAFDAPSWNIAFAPTDLPQWRALWKPVYAIYRLRRREKILAVRDVDVAVSHGEGGGYVVDFAARILFLRRRGTSLVEKEESDSAEIPVPEETGALVDRVSVVAGTAPEDLLMAYFEGLAVAPRGWRRRSSLVVVARDVGFRAASEIEAHQDWYPGVRVVTSAKRSYPHEGLGAHVLGYMQAVSAREYERWRDSYRGSPEKSFRPDDQIGRTGIERTFDFDLRPARGYRLLEVDAARHTQRVLEHHPAVPGADLHLTLDVDVQRAAEQALQSLVGSVVVMEPATGRVLAMASSPAYNANDLRHHPPDPEDPLTPMLNRAIQGQYPLGSAFKLLLALGALEEGKAFREVICRGSYRGRLCRNHRLPLVVRLHEAIKRSCNVYFYRTGAEMLGLRGIVRWGRRCGLGRSTGVPLPGERSGLLPTEAWKVESRGEQWYGGDTLNLSIGQGYLLVTPLQVARFVCAVANGGRLVRPRLVDRVVEPSGRTHVPGEEAETVDLGLSAATIAQLHRAMRGVCHEAGGTARKVWRGWIEEQGYAVGGKTSTADAYLRGRHSNVGWFVCFAPVGDPRVVVVAAIEHEGLHLHGSDVAAPVTRRILERLPERYLEGIGGQELRERHRASLTFARPAPILAEEE